MSNCRICSNELPIERHFICSSCEERRLTRSFDKSIDEFFTRLPSSEMAYKHSLLSALRSIQYLISSDSNKIKEAVIKLKRNKKKLDTVHSFAVCLLERKIIFLQSELTRRHRIVDILDPIDEEFYKAMEFRHTTNDIKESGQERKRRGAYDMLIRLGYSKTEASQMAKIDA